MIRHQPLTRKKPLRRVSKKRVKEMKIYSERRKAFLAAHPICQVWLKENGWRHLIGEHCDNWIKGNSTDGFTVFATSSQTPPTELDNAPKSVEVHHRERRGKKYLDECTWVAVSRENHIRIHNNPKWARENGWLK